MSINNTYRNKLNKAVTLKEDALASLEKGKVSLEQGMKNLTAIEEAQVFLQMIAKETQEKIRYRLEDIVNLALSSVYGPKYRFEIIFEMKRGQTEASLLLYEGDNILDPLENSGGGICDLLSFVLRVALLIISKNRRVLILDEPMKFVSMDYREACYIMMRRLSHELNIQIITVTHEELCVAQSDKVYKVSQKGGISWVQSQ